MAETKTKATAVDVGTFIGNVKSDQKRRDAVTLREMMERISGEPAVMWGPSIIGFGSTHYKYESGHEGDICKMGFSPRSGALTLYLNRNNPESIALMDRLGKHKTSKACLYINKLADVDLGVLEQLVERSWNGPDDCDVC